MQSIQEKSDTEHLLQLKQVKKYYDLSDGFFRKEKQYLRAVDGVDLTVARGETLGIVGESGCGKSTLGNVIMRLLEPTEGQILFEGVDLSKLTHQQMQEKRKDIQMIFQDPYSSLNPRLRVLDIIAEPLRTHKLAIGKELEEKVFALMDIVGLNRSYADRFPHEFSGGQRQRIGIARALALRPKLLVCDEPVSALDVSIQSQILNLLAKLQKEFHLTYIFIGHGLPAVKHVSTRIAVMYLGKIVELATKEQLFSRSLHPYTEGLLSAVPVPDPTLRESRKRVFLTGDLPNPAKPPAGCRFFTRCSYAREVCNQVIPTLQELEPNHYVACHFPLKEGGTL